MNMGRIVLEKEIEDTIELSYEFIPSFFVMIN